MFAFKATNGLSLRHLPECIHFTHYRALFYINYYILIRKNLSLVNAPAHQLLQHLHVQTHNCEISNDFMVSMFDDRSLKLLTQHLTFQLLTLA